MDIEQPLALLGGLSPSQFMRRHWQKKPLVVRQAIPSMEPILTRAALFKLAEQSFVESRLITQHLAIKKKGKKGSGNDSTWQLESGPFASRALPPVTQPGWTLLVQGVDTHDVGVHALLQQFRFVPDARLDDVMISYASPGGGVGPHFDSYDVFLLQASGQRRWKISQQKDLTLQQGVPLKILQNFVPEEEFVLEAGDMLYLPPRYAHDGLAVATDSTSVADCMTYSVGFRAPAKDELASELLHRLADFNVSDDFNGEGCADKPATFAPGLYKDPRQPATVEPAQLPEALLAFAQKAVADALKNPLTLACTLGEYLTEPKGSVWFDEVSAGSWTAASGCQLDARTRMMYDEQHLFINGESHRAKGADAALMRKLANQRCLTVPELRRASEAALGLLEEWADAGWLHALPTADGL
ncbi:MAG: cupin domain-containing protein [Polaromonas sp.]|nr:cupin domain-containing protein [Polaromonas sp.]